MTSRTAALLLVFAGAAFSAGAFEPRARPLRQRLPSAAARNTPHRPAPSDQAGLAQQRRGEPRAAQAGVRAQLLFANAGYEAWVLGGQTDAALLEKVIMTLRQVRAIKPDLVLDERWLPPKLIALWNDTR